MTHTDKSQKNQTFTSFDDDSSFEDNSPKKLSHRQLISRKSFVRKRIWKNLKNEFSDFERWGISTDKIGNKSGTFTAENGKLTLFDLSI